MDEIRNVECVIDNPLNFKNKLGIGEAAFASLRRKKLVGEGVRILDTAGAFGIGAAAAAAAGPLFAPAGLGGILAALGIGATAATPIGWVIAAGVASTAGYYGISRYLRSGRESRVDVVPKWINTPLDALAVVLFDFFAPLGLKVAALDGSISDSERQYIENYFVQEWGYSRQFTRTALPDAELNLGNLRIVELVDNMIKFKIKNPDCNYGSMSNELTGFLDAVTRADGKIPDLEAIFIQWLEITLAKGEPGFWDKLHNAVGFGKMPEKTKNGNGAVPDVASGETAPHDGEQGSKAETDRSDEDDASDSTLVGRNFRHALRRARNRIQKVRFRRP